MAMYSEEVNRIQRSQHGLITRAQALGVGMTDDEILSLERTGRWARLQTGVYAPAGQARSGLTDLRAATLAGGPGTVASHRSAAWLWEMIPPPGVVEVTVTRSRTPRPQGTVLHRSLDLADAEPSTRNGIPTTNPLRTLVDLGAVAPVHVVRDATHEAASRRLITNRSLDAEVGRLAKRGRRGIGPIRTVLEERMQRGHDASALEARVDRVIRRAGLPQPLIERIAGPDGEYRLDYTWQEAMLILEAKGYAWHGSPDAFAKDLERELAIASSGGYQVIAVGWKQVTKNPADLARHLRTIYFDRIRLLRGA